MALKVKVTPTIEALQDRDGTAQTLKDAGLHGIVAFYTISQVFTGEIEPHNLPVLEASSLVEKVEIVP